MSQTLSLLLREFQRGRGSCDLCEAGSAAWGWCRLRVPCGSAFTPDGGVLNEGHSLRSGLKAGLWPVPGALCVHTQPSAPRPLSHRSSCAFTVTSCWLWKGRRVPETQVRCRVQRWFLPFRTLWLPVGCPGLQRRRAQGFFLAEDCAEQPVQAERVTGFGVGRHQPLAMATCVVDRQGVPRSLRERFSCWETYLMLQRSVWISQRRPSGRSSAYPAEVFSVTPWGKPGLGAHGVNLCSEGEVTGTAHAFLVHGSERAQRGDGQPSAGWNRGTLAHRPHTVQRRANLCSPGSHGSYFVSFLLTSW